MNTVTAELCALDRMLSDDNRMQIDGRLLSDPKNFAFEATTDLSIIFVLNSRYRTDLKICLAAG
jgi:hypothetical protein